MPVHISIMLYVILTFCVNSLKFPSLYMVMVVVDYILTGRYYACTTAVYNLEEDLHASSLVMIAKSIPFSI